ncbi:MAG: CARDB domain-containing protein [Candidatus Micrarchaeota archaeon]
MNETKIMLGLLLLLAALAPFVAAAESSDGSKTGITEPVGLPNPFTYHNFNLEKGWNLISMPIHYPVDNFGYVEIQGTNCAKKSFYYYEPSTRNYIADATLAKGEKVMSGRGYWIKADFKCSFQVLGREAVDAADFNGYFQAGWNQVGAPFRALRFSSIAGNCKVVSGPYYFNTNAYKWEKSDFLESSKGYFIKVAEYCQIGNQPPRPPEVTPIPTSTVSPGNVVEIEEFTDFQCPFCQRSQETLTRIEKEYGSNVKIITKNFPLSQIHPFAWKAAEAYECVGKYGGEGAAKKYKATLFSNQEFLDVPNLKKYAYNMGIDKTSFDKCLDSDMMKGSVQADYDEGVKRGVTGTPTFFIMRDKVVVGAQPFAVFKEILDYYLAVATFQPTLKPENYVDLGVADIEVLPNYPKAGESFTAYATVRNYGTAGGYIDSHQISFETGSGKIAASESPGIAVTSAYIAPGGYYKLKFTQTLYDVATYQVKVSVKNKNDYNTANNEYSEYFTVGGATPTATSVPLLPDLTLSVPSPFTPTANTYVKLPFDVINKGAAKSPYTTVSVIGVGPVQTISIPPIEPGQSYSTSVTSWVPDITFALTFRADMYNYVHESNEANNEYVLKMTPNVPTPTPIPTATTMPTCTYYGDGTFSAVAAGCTIITNEDFYVKLVDTAYAPARAQFDISTKYGFLLKRVYLLVGESSIISEANNLQLSVYSIVDEKIYPVRTIVQVNVKSGATPTPTVAPTATAVPAKPDLALITTGTSENRVGKIADIPLVVTNFGNAVSPATTVKFTGHMSGSRTVPSLAPGASHQIIISVVVVDQASMQFTWKVDPDNLIAESSEGNNELSYAILPILASFIPLEYDLVIRPDHSASPTEIRLFNPDDRWRFKGGQYGDFVSITGMEDSTNYDKDFNDLAFDYTRSGNTIKIKITGCNSAAKNKIWVKMKPNEGYKRLSIEETGWFSEGDQGNSVVELFSQCQGNVGVTRTLVIDTPLAA